MSFIGGVTGFFSGLASPSIEAGGFSSGPSSQIPWALPDAGVGVDFGINGFGKPGNPGPWALAPDAGLIQPSGWAMSNPGASGSAPLSIVHAESGLAPPQYASMRSEGVAVWDHQEDSASPSWLRAMTSVGQVQGGEDSSLLVTGSKRAVRSAPDSTAAPGMGVLRPENYRPLMNLGQKALYDLQKNLQGNIRDFQVVKSGTDPVYSDAEIKQVDDAVRSFFSKDFGSGTEDRKPAYNFVKLQNEEDFSNGLRWRNLLKPKAFLDQIIGEFVPGWWFSDPAIYVGNTRRIVATTTGEDLTKEDSALTHEIIHYYAHPNFINRLPMSMTDPRVSIGISEGVTEHFKAEVTGVSSGEVRPGTPYAKAKLTMDWYGRTFGEEMLRKAYFGGDYDSIIQIYNWSLDKFPKK